MKKFLSAVLALTMALALCVPAFAADTVLNGVDGLGEGATVEVTGTTQTATVKVTVPATGSIVLNPYGLDYEFNGQTVQTQIISAEQYIVNESNMPIKVSTKVTGTIEGTGDFAAASAVSETDKKVFLNFEIGKTTAKDTAAASYEKVNLTKTQVSCTDIVMDKMGGTNPAIAFKFTGDAAKNPTNPWTTEDVIGASIAFTFALDNSGAGGGGGTTPSVAASVTGTPAAGGTVTLNAAISNIDASKNPAYSWAVTTDANSIVDSFVDSTAAAQTVNIAAGAQTGQSATLTVTVTYDDQGSGDATVTDTVTITIP